MDDSTEIMDVNEAAAYLRVHIETVRRLARRRALPCFKVGKDWRFSRSALDRWCMAHDSTDASATVLIVDDEPQVCRILVKMIERIGYRALSCTDADTGLGLVARESPGLVLLDLKMPGRNGPQFLAELRKTHLTLPVVIVTGYPDSDLMHQAMQHAPLLVLAKPVERAALEQTIAAVLGEKAARRTG